MYKLLLSLCAALLLLACERSEKGKWTADDLYRVHLACTDTLHDVLSVNLQMAETTCTCIVYGKLQQRYLPWELDDALDTRTLTAIADSCIEQMAPKTLGSTQAAGSKWTRIEHINFLSACTQQMKNLGSTQADSTLVPATFCQCLAGKLALQMPYDELRKLDQQQMTNLAAGCGVALPAGYRAVQ